jgi:hypothetical protein
LGGARANPEAVYGTWKSGTQSAAGAFTVGADTVKNNWNGIPDIIPGGFAAQKNEGFGSEIVWSPVSLGLASGNVYRVQFMVHDGDQNNSGGDVGQACVIVKVP